MTIASTIAALRRERGLTLKQLASLTGLSFGYIRRRSVSIKAAVRLATALGADPAEFVRLVLQERLDAAGVALRVAVYAGDETVWSAEREAFEADVRTFGEQFVEGL
jgi:transcriptional regulator with XRE-family HTH domain